MVKLLVIARKTAVISLRLVELLEGSVCSLILLTIIIIIIIIIIICWRAIGGVVSVFLVIIIRTLVSIVFIATLLKIIFVTSFHSQVRSGVTPFTLGVVTDRWQRMTLCVMFMVIRM